MITQIDAEALPDEVLIGEISWGPQITRPADKLVPLDNLLRRWAAERDLLERHSDSHVTRSLLILELEQVLAEVRLSSR